MAETVVPAETCVDLASDETLKRLRGYVWFANRCVPFRRLIGQCRVGRFLIQNDKVVHRPEKTCEKAEMNRLSHL